MWYTNIYSNIIVHQKYIGTSIKVGCATRSSLSRSWIGVESDRWERHCTLSCLRISFEIRKRESSYCLIRSTYRNRTSWTTISSVPWCTAYPCLRSLLNGLIFHLLKDKLIGHGYLQLCRCFIGVIQLWLSTLLSDPSTRHCSRLLSFFICFESFNFIVVVLSVKADLWAS